MLIADAAANPRIGGGREAIGGGDNAVIFQYLPAPAGVQLGIRNVIFQLNITLAEF